MVFLVCVYSCFKGYISALYLSQSLFANFFPHRYVLVYWLHFETKLFSVLTLKESSFLKQQYGKYPWWWRHLSFCVSDGRGERLTHILCEISLAPSTVTPGLHHLFQPSSFPFIFLRPCISRDRRLKTIPLTRLQISQLTMISKYLKCLIKSPLLLEGSKKYDLLVTLIFNFTNDFQKIFINLKLHRCAGPDGIQVEIPALNRPGSRISTLRKA